MSETSNNDHVRREPVVDRGTPRLPERPGKYLTFSLANEEFGIRVFEVREIMGLQDITRVPQAEPHIRGVINLRGKIVPVICLRTRFGMPQMEYTPRTCIVVVHVRGEDGLMLIGVLVDSVSEVITLDASEIEDTPEFGTGQNLDYILGMAKVRGRVKILIDIERVLTVSEISAVEQLHQ
jgi:purine-binding chemotaxis protein CheW